MERINEGSVDQRVLNFSQRGSRLGHLVRGGEVQGWVLEKEENSFEITTVGNKIRSKLELNERIAKKQKPRGVR